MGEMCGNQQTVEVALTSEKWETLLMLDGTSELAPALEEPTRTYSLCLIIVPESSERRILQKKRAAVLHLHISRLLILRLLI